MEKRFREYLTEGGFPETQGLPQALHIQLLQGSNPRKIYPADPALISAFDISGRSNLGHALETVVLLELERRRAEIAYIFAAPEKRNRLSSHALHNAR